MSRARGAVFLPAAVLAIAVSTVLAAALAGIGRIETLLVSHRQRAAAALAAADACLARVTALLPAGWELDVLLAGPDGTPGTADDGTAVAPPGCVAALAAAPGPALPPRALLTVDARSDGGRRRIQAVLGRASDPGAPSLLWLASVGAVTSLAGLTTLDGVDPLDPARPIAALASPADATDLDAWIVAQGGRVVVASGTGAPLTAPSPPLDALCDRLRATGPPGAETLVPGAPVAVAALVPGDLRIDAPRRGAGVLVVEGRLEVDDALEFDGVLAVLGGLDIAPGATVRVGGTLWLANAPIRLDGALVVRHAAGAVAAAEALLPLPRRARTTGLRDLG